MPRSKGFWVQTMAEIKFSPEAIKDLQQIKAYISDELLSEQAANNTINKIMKNIRMLESFPNSAPVLSGIVGFETDYRYLVCSNYTAFYRVQSETVYIARVLYGRRDFMRILFGTTQEES